MKTKIVGMIAAILLGLGLVAAVPEPAEADSVSWQTSLAVCQYIRPAGWSILYYHTVHYGSAHVTQCEYTSASTSRCRQYVWNIPSPYWDEYEPPYPGAPGPDCW